VTSVNPWLYGSLVLLTTALMGSSFTIGKIGLQFFSPLILTGLRFTQAGLVMAVAVAALRRPHPARATDWLRMLAVGLFQTAGVMGCTFIGLRTITAGESSILTFTNPLLVVVFSTLLGARYRWTQWLGVFLGVAGVAVTLGLQVHLRIGTLLGLASGVWWAVATILVKRWGHRFDIWVLSAYQMLAGGLLLLLSSPLLERPKLQITPLSAGILLWLAIMASVVQFSVWYWLLHHGDPGRTSAFLFLAPFFGVLTGWAVLNEALHLPVLVGGACILSGIFLVNWNPRRMPASVPSGR
jgi:probable blue pigment (indigoidine) exporter